MYKFCYILIWQFPTSQCSTVFTKKYKANDRQTNVGGYLSLHFYPTHKIWCSW